MAGLFLQQNGLMLIDVRCEFYHRTKHHLETYAFNVVFPQTPGILRRNLRQINGPSFICTVFHLYFCFNAS